MMYMEAFWQHLTWREVVKSEANFKRRCEKEYPGGMKEKETVVTWVAFFKMLRSGWFNDSYDCESDDCESDEL